MTPKRVLRTSLIVSLVFLAGCKRQSAEPESRPEPTASSEPPPAQFLAPSPHAGASPHGDMQSPHGDTPTDTAAAGKLVWSDPPGWQRSAQSSPMRMATYRIPHGAADKDDAELAVFHFGGGQGGDVEANLKRWEGQFSDKKSEAKRAERVVNGLKAHVLEVDSGTYTAMAMMPGQTSSAKSDYAMIASVVETPLGSYFFKLTGPAKTVKAQKDAYMTMLDSVKVQS
ncbi:MAG TPA: hypothetical protein VH062_14565 [Polyangiaceae bacterium]|jgi:hypothetical protein|nr:hypothetical protein [Polyangiaceae bacterium]